MTYKPEKGSRQPVVLYDQDNKAIDVSGIEELPSIKIDTGKIAGDLKLVKDNQGRLYGKYGEAWIPVKVDSEGRPIIASDVTVTADGLIVDLGQIKQGPAGTEPWPVQLSGTNIIKKETVITRGTRTTSQNSDVITPPVEARGFVAKLRVYGITGTFGVGEGVGMRVSHRLAGAGITRVFRNVYTKYLPTTRIHTCLWFPGLESNIMLDSIFEQEAAGGGGLMVGLPVHDAYMFSIGIRGSFATGQGVDCDLVVEWYR